MLREPSDREYPNFTNIQRKPSINSKGETKQQANYETNTKALLAIKEYTYNKEVAPFSNVDTNLGHFTYHKFKSTNQMTKCCKKIYKQNKNKPNKQHINADGTPSRRRKPPPFILRRAASSPEDLKRKAISCLNKLSEQRHLSHGAGGVGDDGGLPVAHAILHGQDPHLHRNGGAAR